MVEEEEEDDEEDDEEEEEPEVCTHTPHAPTHPVSLNLCV